MNYVFAVMLTALLIITIAQHRALYEWVKEDIMNTLLVVVGVLMIITFGYQEFILEPKLLHQVNIRQLQP